jgi:hypothetical protein
MARPDLAGVKAGQRDEEETQDAETVRGRGREENFGLGVGAEAVKAAASRRTPR